MHLQLLNAQTYKYKSHSASAPEHHENVRMLFIM